MKWKDSEFTLKENVLGMYRDAYPLIEERDKLIYEATKNIDRSVILNYDRQIRALQKTRLELTVRIEKLSGKKTDSLEKELLKVEKQIEDSLQKYETDSTVNSVNQFYKSKVLSCGIRLMLNKDLMSRMMPMILEGGDITVLDYDNEDCIKDVVGVAVSDFFHVMRQKQFII